MSASTSNTGNKGSSSNPSATGNQASSATGDVLSQSKDVQTMISVLKDMGIEEFEPRVINQLLEFSYRYREIHIYRIIRYLFYIYLDIYSFLQVYY